MIKCYIFQVSSAQADLAHSVMELCFHRIMSVNIIVKQDPFQLVDSCTGAVLQQVWLHFDTDK